MRSTLERLIASPEGMLLVTGPTGSGKTTTLYAAIHYIDTPENKILTDEDPIEYYFPKTFGIDPRLITGCLLREVPYRMLEGDEEAGGRVDSHLSLGAQWCMLVYP